MLVYYGVTCNKCDFYLLIYFGSNIVPSSVLFCIKIYTALLLVADPQIVCMLVYTKYKLSEVPSMSVWGRNPIILATKIGSFGL